MIRKTLATATIVAVSLTLTASGCAKKDAPKPADAPAAMPAPAPLAVASVDLGRAIGPDKMVSAPVMTFGVHDTIYVSVSTTGVGENAALEAKWSFLNKEGNALPVNQGSQTITTTGPSVSEFHITKATPWPKGRYRVEVMLNGAEGGIKEFDVQ
jgi:hypothetical protein